MKTLKQYEVSASWCEELKLLQVIASGPDEAIAAFEEKFPGVSSWYSNRGQDGSMLPDIYEVCGSDGRWKGDGHTVVLQPYNYL